MKLYDTLSGKKKKLDHPKEKPLRLFVCGPTVYDYIQIGNARTFVFFDIFTKYLRHLGFNVKYHQNITDIDDKIIARAKEKKQTPKKIAQQFENQYYRDTKTLGIDAVDAYHRATDHMPEIISQVKRLLEKGYAYKISDDGIYFDISRLKDYGKLSGRTALGAEDATSRIDDSVAKTNRGDFALWKFHKPGEPKWKSPWGEGRPGWHIEDTAITEKHLGPQYEMHGGGRDLIFPHHEAEIAQMEAISNKKPFVKYWLHPGFVTVNGEKMSKSKGNFITVNDALKKYDAETLRMFFITKHYRSPIDYTEKGLQESQANIQRIKEFKDSLDKKASAPTDKKLKQFIKNFFNELADDFNTPKAFSHLFKLITYTNKKKQLSAADKKQILEFLENINKIFAIISTKKEAVPAQVKKIAQEREKARMGKDWVKADTLRKDIESLGYTVEDTSDGPKIKKL